MKHPPKLVPIPSTTRKAPLKQPSLQKGPSTSQPAPPSFQLYPDRPRPTPSPLFRPKPSPLKHNHTGPIPQPPTDSYPLMQPSEVRPQG